MKKLEISIYFILILSSLYLVSCVDQKRQSVPSVGSGRQISIWPFNFNSRLSRQIFDMLDIVTDVAVLTFLGIPILGLVALGASVMGPALQAATKGGRNKRSLDVLDRTKRALLYARNLFDVLANLEDTFRKYEITESECQLKAVCEAHKKSTNLNPKYHNFGTQIVDLIRMQKDLEEYEIIPFAKIIFGQYADAATYGNEDNDCDMVYSRCSHNLNDILNESVKPKTENESIL